MFLRHLPPQALCTDCALGLAFLLCPGSLLELRVPHHTHPTGWKNSVSCVYRAKILVFLLVVGVQSPSGPSGDPQVQPHGSLTAWQLASSLQPTVCYS